MQFTPKTDKEIQSERAKFQPFPPGRYDFEIIEAKDETSKKGNQMLHLTLKCFNDEGHARFVHDYITEAISHKLKHLCYAVGLGIKYESGCVSADDCVGRSGKVALRIKSDPGYEPKNEAVDYIVPADYQEQKEVVGTAVMKQGRQLAPAGNSADDLDPDQIPF